jgi:hypothetical protein
LITIPINISNIGNAFELDAFGFSVHFSDGLQLESVEKVGTIVESFSLVEGQVISPGTLKVNGAKFGSTVNVNSEGLFVKLIFKVMEVSAQETTLELFNFINDIQNATTSPATISISEKSSKISNLRETNIEGIQFSVSWTSTNEDIGKIMYGTDINNSEVWKTAYDDRCDLFDNKINHLTSETWNTAYNDLRFLCKDNIHHVTIKGLSPDTTYYYSVLSGDTIDNNNGNFYSINTGPLLEPSAGSCQPSGQIFMDEEKTQPADNVIVYVTILGESKESNSATNSTLVVNGHWFVDLVNSRSLDLSQPYAYSCGVSSIFVETVAGNGKTDQLTMIAENYPVIASVPLIPSEAHSITVTQNNHGLISPSDGILAKHNSSQTFVIEPEECYRVENVLVDGEPVGQLTSYTFANIIEDRRIEATYALKSYEIQVLSGENGHITPQQNPFVNCGSDTTFSITPDTYYKIQDVKVDGVSFGAISEYHFQNVTATHTIEATFSINEHIITAISGSNGTINPEGNSTIIRGTDATYTFTPDRCYQVHDIKVDGISMGALNEYTFENVIEDHTIEAIFSLKDFTIKATSGSNGTIEPIGDISVPCSNDQKFTIIPDEHYNIDDIKVDGESKGSLSEFTFQDIDTPHTIEATFSKIFYTIDASAGEHGRIEPSGEVLVGSGSNRRFSITPDEHFKIEDVLINGVSVGAVDEYTIVNVSEFQTIEAVFSIKQYTIETIADGNGQITPSGIVIVDSGSSKTFTIVSDDCHYIYDVRIDGQSFGQITAYTFSDITESHQIEVNFNVYQYHIDISSDMGGTIRSIDPGSGPTFAFIECGQDFVFTVTPENEFQIYDVLIDDISVGTETAYTLSNVSNDHSVHATFAAVYNIQEGWNLLNFVFTPEDNFTAQSLANAINQDDGDVITIQHWYGSGWQTYNVGASFGDFKISRGNGYFLLSNKASKWLNVGKEWDSEQYSINQGYNLLGFPSTSWSNTRELVDYIHRSSSAKIMKVQKWDGNRWQTYSINAPYTSFDIKATEGYFLLATDPGIFEFIRMLPLGY